MRKLVGFSLTVLENLIPNVSGHECTDPSKSTNQSKHQSSTGKIGKEKCWKAHIGTLSKKIEDSWGFITPRVFLGIELEGLRAWGLLEVLSWGHFQSERDYRSSTEQNLWCRGTEWLRPVKCRTPLSPEIQFLRPVLTTDWVTLSVIPSSNT